MHLNSLEAYRQERAKLTARAELLYAYMLGKPAMTDREVRDILFPEGDMNMVRPRITELIQDGWLREVGTCKDVTGKTVRLVRARTQAEMLADQPQQELLFA